MFINWIKITTGIALLMALIVEVRAYQKAVGWNLAVQLPRHREVLQQNSKHRAALAYSELGNLAMRQKQFNEAEAFYRKATVIYPGSAEAHYGMARILTIRRDFINAVEQYREAIKLNPYEGEYQFGLANISLMQGQLEAATQYFYEGLKTRPDARAHNHLARLLAAQGRLDEAIEYFRDALRIDPAFIQAHEGLSIALAERGEAAQARHHYDEAVRLLGNPTGGVRRR